MPRPLSHYGTGKNRNKLKSASPEWHSKKPDLDNLVKFVKDCLNGIAWKDDAQVVTLAATKKYDENPRTMIEINQFGH
jgi:Holliday junction resolvase RusA-like endonuclease